MALTYKAVLIHELDGRYSAVAPALKVASWGESVPEALRMVQEALAGYIECRREHGTPLAPDTDTFTVDMGDAAEAHVYVVTVPESEAVPAV